MDITTIIIAALSGISGGASGVAGAITIARNGLVPKWSCDNRHAELRESLALLREDSRKLFELQEHSARKMDELVGYLKAKGGQGL